MAPTRFSLKFESHLRLIQRTGGRSRRLTLANLAAIPSAQFEDSMPQIFFSYPSVSGKRVMAPSLPAFLQNVEWKRFAGDPFPFLFAWVLAGLLSVVIPRSHWNAKKQEYYTYYGYAVEYEQAQRQNENNNNNNNNQNQYQYSNACSWWDWGCRKRVAQYSQYQNNNNGDDRDDEIQVPNWYRFMGGSTEEERRDREEEGQSSESSAMKFVYAWSLMIFMLLVVYGAVAVYRKHNLNTLRWCLFLFANVSLLLMILCVQGVIETDGRAMEDSIYGWYGQTGVFMVYSCFAYMLFSFIGSVVISLRMYWLARMARAGDSTEEEAESTGLFTKPKVSVTGESDGAYQKYDDAA